MAWIFAILFIVSAFAVTYTYFPIGKLLNPSFYQQSLKQVGIYERLPASIASLLAERISPTSDSSDSGISLMILSEAEWESILVDLIDPEWIHSQSDQVIEQVFDILLISEDPLNKPVEISVSEIKENVAGQAGVQAISQIIAAQPPCSLDQLLGLVQAGLGMESALGSLLCRPPEFILSEIDPLVESLLSTAVAQVPDQISFYIPFPQTGQQEDRIQGSQSEVTLPEPVRILRQVNTINRLSPLLPLFLLSLLTLFAVRSIKDLTAWWGGSFLAAGSISLVSVLFIRPSANWLLSSYMPLGLIQNISLPDFLVQIGITDLYQELTNQLLLSIILPASIMTAVGIVLLGVYYLLSRDSVKPIPQSSHLQPNLPDSQHVEEL